MDINYINLSSVVCDPRDGLDAKLTEKLFKKIMVDPWFLTRYEFWEVDGILFEELFRSIVLALGCVFLIVVFMLANITGAVLVLLCVIFTLVDVMGFMYFWGLTVDTTTSMLLIVCIGLSVDYAAHIAHGFLEV